MHLDHDKPTQIKLALTRRGFLQGAAAATAMTLFSRRLFGGDATGGIVLPEAARLKPLRSRDIKDSRLSIGFETLDRQQFDPKRTYDHLGKLGVKWARAQTGWCRCETVKGQYDFRWLDEVVNGLLAQGIEPWFNLGYGNRLYIPEAPDVSAVGYCPMFTAEARNAWAAFVAAIAAHFGDRVKKWEIWNEPNHRAFWRPDKPNAAAYVELVKFTAPIIRQHIPGVVIVGLAQSCCKIPYTAEALQAGLAEHVDRLSFHPYGSMPEQSESYVNEVRELLGPRRETVKLWQGECGCPSDPKTEKGTDKRGRTWNEQRQARWLMRRILTDLRQDLELTSYFSTVDLTHYNWGKGRSNSSQSYGVLRGADYSPKPSYYAYQSLCSLFDAQTQLDPQVALAGGGADDKALQSAGFVRNGRALCAYWLAADLLEPFTPGTISLRLSAPPDAALQRPVLIDPLSQRVYDLKRAAPQSDGLALADLPLLDYPLIIADLSVVPTMR